jgi:electron transfer flavoprotein beta subunit
MQIYVCVKHVPDTAANIKIVGENGFDDADCKFIPNPYDEYALEQAVQLVEKNGGEVIIVTAGKAAAAATIRAGMAMGAKRGILVTADSQFLDSQVTARLLAAAIQQDGQPDIIFAGKAAVDTEGFQTPYRLAALMNLPVASEISKMEIDGGKAVVGREIGGGVRETLEVDLPCVISATKGLNEPRYPKFPDIMKAKKKEIKQMALTDLAPSVGSAQSELVKLEKVPQRSGAKMLDGCSPGGGRIGKNSNTGRKSYLVPIHKWLICPISASGLNFNLSKYLSVFLRFKFSAFRELEQIILFLDGHDLCKRHSKVVEKGENPWQLSAS